MAVSSHSNATAEPDANALARLIEEKVKLHDFTLASAAEQTGAPLELIQLIYSRHEVLNAQLQQVINAATEGWQLRQLAQAEVAEVRTVEAARFAEASAKAKAEGKLVQVRAAAARAVAGVTKAADERLNKAVLDAEETLQRRHATELSELEARTACTLEEKRAVISAAGARAEGERAKAEARAEHGERMTAQLRGQLAISEETERRLQASASTLDMQ